MPLPDCPFPAEQIILKDDSSQRATLAHAGTITNEEPRSVTTGQGDAVTLAGVCDGFELQGGQLTVVYGALRDRQLVENVRGLYTRHGARFYHWVRMLDAQPH